jgi:uncharacterized protein
VNSALYFGTVRHRRLGTPAHAFGYRVGFLYLDLDELDSVFRGRLLWRLGVYGVYSFSRRGHLGDERRSLADDVRDLVQLRTGERPLGPVRLLTQPRVLGFVFNPVSFYYCFDAAGRELEALVVEINNTPWNEQHCYVFGRTSDSAAGEPWRFRFAKDFHVSPFFPMEHEYDWRFTAPGEDLAVNMSSFEGEDHVFDAVLVARRRALDGRGLARLALRSPVMSVTGLVAIYWQAWRLKWKGARFHEHPKQRVASAARERATSHTR